MECDLDHMRHMRHTRLTGYPGRPRVKPPPDDPTIRPSRPTRPSVECASRAGDRRKTRHLCTVGATGTQRAKIENSRL